MKLMLLCLLSLITANSIAQRKFKIKHDGRSLTFKAGDGILLLNERDDELNSRIWIHEFTDNGIVFIEEAITCEYDTIKRIFGPRRRLYKKGYQSVKVYGRVGRISTEILCRPTEFTCDTILLEDVHSIISWKHEYRANRNTTTEQIVFTTGFLTTLFSPLTGISSDGYKWKRVGITAGVGALPCIGILWNIRHQIKYSKPFVLEEKNYKIR